MRKYVILKKDFIKGVANKNKGLDESMKKNEKMCFNIGVNKYPRIEAIIK